MIDLAQPVRQATASRPVAGGDDLFALGRAAAAAARQATGARAVFTRSRQLLASGAWRGPRDAADAFVEEQDLTDVQAAVRAGVRTLIATTPALLPTARGAGLRCVLRLPFAAGEPDRERMARIEAAAGWDAVLPTPVGEPLGLDTLRFFAQCRLAAPGRALLADFARLGHRLAQMALEFGADELHGPIVAERALRLGDNAGNPAMTRKEAAILIRGAGLTPCERVSGGGLEEAP